MRFEPSGVHEYQYLKTIFMAEENKIPQKAKTPLQMFNGYIMNPGTQDYLKSVLGQKAGSFVNNMVALVSNNAMLQKCTPSSLIYAGIKATALDLPLDQNLGFAYVIPYNNTAQNITEAQFQLGYRGAIQLAIRSGVFKSINVTDIREGEMKNRNILTGDIQFEEVPDRESKKIVGYAAYFALTNGFSKTMYMTVEEMDAHAKRYSQTYKSKYEKVRATSMWTTDFHKMAKKTVLKLLLSKYAPLSVEMRDAIKYDQSVIRENGEPDYVDGVDIQDEAVVETVEEQKKEMKEKNSKEAGTLL